MKANKKGLSIIKAFIVVIFTCLILFAGWYIWQSSNKNTTTNNTSHTQQKTSNQESTMSEIDTTIHEVSITLKSEADLTKLPDYTPSSFKTYIADKLVNNKSFNQGEVLLTPTLKINKISQVNIKGGTYPSDEDGNGYPGGAPLIWVLTPAGTWDEESLNGPVCISKNGGKIYEEFAYNCKNDAYPDGTRNPNGSIQSLSQ